MAVKARIAFAARTAHDLTHVNRLRVPEFGVIKLCLTGSNKSSKSYTVDGAPPPKKNDGSDEFHFAPGPQLDATSWAVDTAKTDKVVIQYELLNPCGAIKEARLELFSRYSEDPFWSRDLKDDELNDGEHKLEFDSTAEWDGAVEVKDERPDGFITVDGSPYKVKLTVTGQGICVSPAAWTYFHVLIAKLELEYGPPEVLPATLPDVADHRAVLTEAKKQGDKPPASGASAVKVYMESNIFKKGHSMKDDSLYDEYNTMWSTGPLIPLFAKVWIKDSADKKVLAPKALGLTRFLWDWESKADVTNNTFVDQAQDYWKDTTKPDGQNCHFDRGGKRGDNTDPVFPVQAGYDPKDALDDAVFPFEVTACPDPRNWSALSRAWREKKLASKTGVLFQPARTAGDTYTVTCYVAWDKTDDGKFKLNTDAKAPLKVEAVLKADSGPFQTWRRIRFVKYLKKSGSVSTILVSSIQPVYLPAFIDLEDDSGAIQTVPSATWNDAFTSAISGWGPIDTLLVDPSVDQATQGPAGAYFRNREEFSRAWIADALQRALPILTGAQATNYANIAYDRQASDVQAAARLDGFSNSDAAVIAQQAIDDYNLVAAYMSNAANSLATDADFALWCQGKAIRILKTIFDDYLDDKEGVNLFQVDRSHNLVDNQTRLTDGEAYDFPNGSDRKCAFLCMGYPQLYAGRPVSADQTAAHEFGHHFFLPHTPLAGERVDYNAHDKDVDNCLMSYNDTTAREVCGFCRLRLRGWSKAALDPDGTANHKA